MKVIVYVEGKSDVVVMRALLRDLITEKQQQGILIEFFETAVGDRKKTLLTKMPIRAINILNSDPVSVVVVLPDLYPDVVFSHRTCAELTAGVRKIFMNALAAKGYNEKQFIDRFHVFCFKHDLEALVLAA